MRKYAIRAVSALLGLICLLSINLFSTGTASASGEYFRITENSCWFYNWTCAFEDINYYQTHAVGGFHVTQDEPDLGAHGWNDRISSIVNDGAGVCFYEHWWYGGWYYMMPSGSSIWHVGPAFNDTFSSADLWC